MKIVALDKARDYYSKHVNIRLEPDQMYSDDVDGLFSLTQQYHGSCGLMFHVDIKRRKRAEDFISQCEGFFQTGISQ